MASAPSIPQHEAYRLAGMVVGRLPPGHVIAEVRAIGQDSALVPRFENLVVGEVRHRSGVGVLVAAILAVWVDGSLDACDDLDQRRGDLRLAHLRQRAHRVLVHLPLRGGATLAVLVSDIRGVCRAHLLDRLRQVAPKLGSSVGHGIVAVNDEHSGPSLAVGGEG